MQLETYTAKQRKTEHNGLTDKHIKWTHPSDQNLLRTKPVLLQLVRAIHISLTCLATALRLTVQEDRLTRLGHNKHVDQLSDNTKDKLDPEDPVETRKVFLLALDTACDKTTDKRAHGSTGHGRKHNKSNSILLIVDIEQVGNNAERNTATGRAETTEETGCNQVLKVGSKPCPHLCAVDEEQ